MKDLKDKVAVVTGGGSGIGRGMAHAFADAGMHVVIADIDFEAAESVAKELQDKYGVKTLPVRTNVADRQSVEELATATFEKMGGAHVLCNNAGVGVYGALDKMNDNDWEWVLSVNLQGVVNGLQAFLPKMEELDGEKHVVNTASMAGMVAIPGLGVYNASKYAVVGISETLRSDLAGKKIGVSVLCPGLVATNIASSERNRPDELGGPEAENAIPQADGLLAADAIEKQGMDPLRVGRIVREAVTNNDLYIFTHPEFGQMAEMRFNAIRTAFQKWKERNVQ